MNRLVAPIRKGRRLGLDKGTCRPDKIHHDQGVWRDKTLGATAGSVFKGTCSVSKFVKVPGRNEVRGEEVSNNLVVRRELGEVRLELLHGLLTS